MRTAVCPVCGQRKLKWAQNALGMRYLVDFDSGAEHYRTCPGVKPGAGSEPLSGPEPGGMVTAGMAQSAPSGSVATAATEPSGAEPSGIPGNEPGTTTQSSEPGQSGTEPGQSGQSSEPSEPGAEPSAEPEPATIPSNGQSGQSSSATEPEPEPASEPEPDPQIVREWVAYVQAVRKRAAELKQRFVVSPRASINGAVLLRAGEPWAEVAESVLWKGHPADQRAEIERTVPAPSYAAAPYAARKRCALGSDHTTTDRLVRYLKLGRNVQLVGGAGGGKTTGAARAAALLGRPYFEASMGPQTSQWDLAGFVGPNGNYIPGIAYEPFKNGGVLMLDEMDAANPAVLIVLNSLMANGHYTFPNRERVERHPEFCLIAGCNTFGRGADRVYVGRLQLDAATLDRFCVIEWDYDERAERIWAGAAR